MDYRRFSNTYVVKIDKGEDIVERLEFLCRKENITLGTITGIGAANKVVIGLFETETKEYRSVEVNGDYEITSLTGNITTKNGEPYLHLHATLGNISYHLIGGHLNSAIVSGAGEVVINVIEGKVEREFDPDIGLNLLKMIE